MRTIPNSYQKPNLYTDRLMRFLTGDEWKTLDYALRRTFGFQRERDRISVSQFMNGNGRRDDDGNLVEYGTGLSRAAQIAAINELVRFGVLMELAPDSKKRGRLWTLQLEESRIRMDLLMERHGEKRARGRSRTAAARQAQLDTQMVDAEWDDEDMTSVSQTDRYWSVRQTDIGQSDRPILVSQTDRYWSDPQTNIGLSHRHTETQKKQRRNPGETQAESEEGAGAPAVIEAWRLLVGLCEGDEAVATNVWRLQEKFAEVTRLRRPDPATDAGREKLLGEWWPHLRQVLADADDDLGTAEAAMQEAFQSMTERPKPLTVIGPRSIVNVTNAVLAGKRRGPGAGTAQQRPKGFAGLAAYSSRRGLNNDS